MERNELRRGLVTPLLVFGLAFGAFFRMPGSENVRAVQMVALLGAGMGLGVALAYLRVLLAMRSGK